MNGDPLYDAVKDGNLERVKTLFDRPTVVKINKLHDDTETLLAAAVRMQHQDIVKYLLDKGADANIKTYSGKAPLHLACFEGNLPITEILVKHGADKEIGDDNGKVPMHWAVKQNRADITRILAVNGAKMDAQATGGDTLLHEAIANAQRDVVECLLEHGVNVRTPNEDGEMPLHVAAKTGREIIAEILLQHGAEINDFTNTGESVLHICSRTGHTKMVKHILEETKIPPEFINKQTTGGKSLLKGKTQSTEGWTALHMACAQGHIDIVQALVDNSADKEIQTKSKKNAVDVAKFFNQVKVVSLLTGEEVQEEAPTTESSRRASVGTTRRPSLPSQSQQQKNTTRRTSVTQQKANTGNWSNF